MSDLTFDRFADLERALSDLAPQVAFPPAPDIAATIRARIAAQPQPAPRRWTWPALFQPRRLAIACLALLLLFVAALTVSTDLRTTIAKRLGIHGIEIIFVEETPTPVATPVGATLLLGEPMTLAEAQARVGYAIKLPATLGEPDEVYLRQVAAGQMVTLLYQARADLPEASETGVGALLMQFPADSKIGDIAKRVSRGMGSMLDVSVNGNPGLWITGETELVIDLDPSAGWQSPAGRPSANVLIWEEGGMTYRLETSLRLLEATALAESVTAPVP
jgi:hypothetical protein